jgi:biopolymer transport protein ExbB
MAEQGQFGRALERLKLADADCFAGRVLRAGLKRASQGPLGPLEARSAMEDAGGEESMQLEQRLDWLAAIANIATLLGLLGTVQGMIGAFETVATSAVNDSGYYQRLAENISIALITTFQGLCVAIPCIALHTFLRTRLTRIVAIVGDECDRVVAELERHAAKGRGGRA